MRWALDRPNPGDPWTRFSCYKWLITRTFGRLVAPTARHAHGRILDVGCGDRRVAHYFSAVADRYIGLDYPTTFYGQRDNVDVFGTALMLPFQDDSFDTVVSFEVLEHVTNPQAMVAELQRVVKPDGRVILTTPFMWGEHCEPHDYFRFSVYGLRRLFEDVGLEVVEQRRAGGFWTFFGQRLCYYLHHVFGPRLAWMHTSLSFMILVCSSLLERLDLVTTEYANSLIVGRRPIGEA